jgi:type I restriction enzyme S subunit
MTPWPKVRLGEVLRRGGEMIEPQADAEYREITVRLWGKGVVERGRVSGAAISGRRFIARSGQFIASRIDARNGAMGLVPDSLDGALVTNDFPLFDLDPSRLEPGFFGWLCRTPGFVELCLRASEGTTNRVRLKEDRFLQLEIPLPPLAEQRRVVARIEELAAQIHEARTLRHQAAEEAEALVGARAFEIFRAATRNGSAPLESVAVLERGKFSHRPRNEPRFFGGDYPWIQIGEIESSNKYIRTWTQTLNDDGLAISKKFPRGTVLISIAATIGAVGILDFDCCIPDSIVGVTPKPQTDSEFLYHYLGFLRGHLEEIAPQSAQKNINLGILTDVPVPKLAVADQRRIVTELDALQAEVDALKRLQSETAAEVDALLPALLDRAFKGEL